jgi:CheY-like chemotaxis protein
MLQGKYGLGDGAGLASRRILLIEDEDDIRGVVAWLLESAGYQVLQAVDGKDAIRALAEGSMSGDRPDLIVMDLLMPDMTGEEFLRWKSEALSKSISTIPVVVVTGVAEVPRFVKSQANAVLGKPVQISELETEISRVLGGASHGAEVIQTRDRPRTND